MGKTKLRIIFLLFLLINIFCIQNVFAAESSFAITKFEVKDKSESVIVNNVSVDGLTINNDVEFDKVGDYIKYDINIKNVTEKNYVIKSISDDNDSEYIEYAYDKLENVSFAAGTEKSLVLTINYSKEPDAERMINNVVHLLLTYEDENENTMTEDIVVKPEDNSGDVNNQNNNPDTGDNIIIYFVIGIVLVLLILIIVFKLNKKNNLKSLLIIGFVGITIFPFVVKSDSINILISFNNKIKVNINNEKIEDDSKILLDKEKITVDIGDTVSLLATVVSNSDTNKDIIWTSSDEKIAKVDNKGKVTAVGDGLATITARIGNGQTASCVIDSKEIATVHFYNPGYKSDAIFVQSGDKTMIIDSGIRTATNHFDEYIKELGVNQIDYYVGTHGHKDHVETAGTIIREFNIKTIYVPAGDIPENLQDTDHSWYTENENLQYKGTVYKNYAIVEMLMRCKNAEERLAIESAQIIYLDKNSPEIKLGNSTFKILNPLSPNWPEEEGAEINTNSLVLRMTRGDVSFLFAADVWNVNRNSVLAKTFGDLFKADVYKNGHHHYRLLTEDDPPKIKQRYNKIQPTYVVMTADHYDEFLSTKIGDIENVYSVNCGTVVMETDGRIVNGVKNINVLSGYKYYLDDQKTVCNSLIRN